MASVSNALSGTTTYVYDSDGRRVEKSTGKLYWYGADGNVLSESDLSGNITDDYIFFNGQRIARVDSSGNVDYYLSDSLGSSRVVTDSNGNILDDCDFLPFGDEQCAASSSGNNYKFTGMERDSESQLDHTLNRQFSSTYDRWLSPDPLGGRLADPQTWNAYAYAGNNPTTFTDPTGEDYNICVQDNGQNQCTQIPSDEAFQAALANPGVGITIQGNQQSGSIYGTDANGQQVLIGSYQHYIGPGEEGGGLQNDIGADLVIGGGISAAFKAGMGILDSFANGARNLSGVGASEAATSTATEEAVIVSGSKGAVRTALDSAPINSAQRVAVKRAIDRAAAGDTVTITRLPDGAIRVSTKVLGRSGGFATYEKVIGPGGATLPGSVIQSGYDAEGNLVHYDPKY